MIACVAALSVLLILSCLTLGLSLFSLWRIAEVRDLLLDLLNDDITIDRQANAAVDLNNRLLELQRERFSVLSVSPKTRTSK